MASRDYESETLTVHWDSDRCIHSAHCATTLPTVFLPGQKPWIDVAGASDEQIAATVDGCPSGALSYTRTTASDTNPAAEDPTEADVTVRVWADGPYEISGTVRVVDNDGNLIRETQKVSLCRCGHSSAKPFCDGTHKHCGFSDPGLFSKPNRKDSPSTD